MLRAYLYTIFFVFCYTSWRFYEFFGTNLLTRCDSASSLFSAILVLEKLHKKYSQNWTKEKPNLLFLPKLREAEDEMEGARGPASPPGARPSPWPCPPVVRPPGPTSDAAPSPISSPRREKPRGRISFPQNILQAATVARSGGSRSSSRHPVGGLLHHHGHLRSDV
jgi:hypothetical protein